LCKLLMRITVHKALRQIHFHQAAKRNPRAELGQGAEANERLLTVIDRDPSPDEAVAFVDHLEHFLGGLKAQEREILEMRLQGYSNDEIAQKLGIYDRKIRRVIERLRGMAVQENWSA
ncbi:MAG TPA: sigma factor-like helix-turn-helix DNA-binding protein, partial [Gemmataceae bacterium]|nr:sigma factor-like helix-turn-helix DNA-binding protein [Gemmataceae bacterium]